MKSPQYQLRASSTPQGLFIMKSMKSSQSRKLWVLSTVDDNQTSFCDSIIQTTLRFWMVSQPMWGTVNEFNKILVPIYIYIYICIHIYIYIHTVHPIGSDILAVIFKAQSSKLKAQSSKVSVLNYHLRERRSRFCIYMYIYKYTHKYICVFIDI